MSKFERFLDLPLGQKIGAICLTVASLYMIAFLVLSSFNTKEEPEVVVPPAPIVNTVEPSGEPTEGESPQAPNKRPVAGGERIPEIGANKLSVKESRAALEHAEKGLTEFINWPVGQKLEARQKNVDKYFTKTSSTRLKEPTLGDTSLSSIDEESGKSLVSSFGKVKSIKVVGGDSKRFRALIGAELRYQITEPSTGTSLSAVELSYPVYVVDLTKEKNGWKILEVVRDN